MSKTTIATWNVNSLRARAGRVRAWLAAHAPDVLCLQETKARDEDFPRDVFTDAGYVVEAFGEKGRNGVAIAARGPLEDVRRGLPGDAPDAERRVLAARAAGVRVITVYAPNGQAVRTEPYLAKLDWYYRLAKHLKETYDPAEPLVLLGDMNVAPDDRDVHDPALWGGGILCSAPERAALRTLMGFGLEDALRRLTADGGQFTWWDYSPASFKRDRGLRIDLVLATRALAERVESLVADKAERAPGGAEKPSDHAPVTATFRDGP